MRKATLIGIAALCLAGLGSAHARADGMSATTVKQGEKVTLVGEVLDMDCYMNEGLHGAAHRSCAVVCLDKGSPVGLLTKDGKAYFLAADKGKTKDYERVRGMGGERVKITGVILERGGALCLDVDRAVRQ